MRTKGMLALCAGLMLCGCASMNYVMNEYGDMHATQFEIAGKDTYRVFDKPSANKIMITPSMGRAASAGFASGMTFGAIAAEDNLGPKPEFEAAALAYLESTGRKCRIIDGYVVIRGQWEFKYDCAPVAVAQPPSRRRG